MNVQELIEELNCVKRALLYGHSKISVPKVGVHSDYAKSATNLFHYLVLRSFDLRPLQKKLAELGFSALGTAEGYVLQNLNHVLAHLKRLIGHDVAFDLYDDGLGFEESRKLLEDHKRALFGNNEGNPTTHIMVTLPTEAAYDGEMVLAMVKSGMNIARINLSHDNEDVWRAMVSQVKRASKSLGKPIKVYMDLAGPKIRTGDISFQNKKGKTVKKLPVRQGEHILLTKNPVLNPKSSFDKNGRQQTVAEINVSLPQIIDDVQLGDSILFDDGMIRGHVLKKETASVLVEITKCFKSKLGSQKGINLPNTRLHLPALTGDDIKVLPFACEHADILGYSFVRSKDDVAVLYKTLEELKAKDIGVVFKIENQEAFENFPTILMKGMERNNIGVMIARGDLAVEIGFERISEVQKELLWLCEAAHIPVMWATQVLETLAKKGIPTRAEVSDAAEGARAECVMLNKGPHINEAISTLRNILDKMDAHVSKKKESLRALNIAKKYIEWQDQELKLSY